MKSALHDTAAPSWAFEGLRPFKYGVIYADPCWRYAMYGPGGYKKSPESHYKTMPLEEIKALPVNDLAAGDCLLILWSTWPHLTLALEVMKAWGFTYKTGGAWVKRTRHRKTCFGTGYLLRSASEPYLVGTIGKPVIHSKSERNVIEPYAPEEFPALIDAERREHSRKPDEMRAIIERLCPDVFCVDLFARESWPGHDVWGDEVGKYGDDQ